MESNRLAKLEAARKRYQAVLAKHPLLSEIEQRLIELHTDKVLRRVEGPAAAVELQRLLGQRAAYLREHGISEHFSEPEWDCPLCEDTGVLDGKPCICEQRRWLERRFQGARLPSRLREQTFSAFSLEWYSPERKTPLGVSERENAMQVLRVCQTFVARVMEDVTTAPGLFITGGSGLGKTFLCSAICHALSENGIVSLYTTYADLLANIKAGFDASQSAGQTSLIDAARRVPVLILDDLGAEYATDFATSCLFDIVNHRRNERLPMVISSNLTLSETGARYDERIRSRLGEVCQLVPLFGTDIRVLQRLG